ncbi:MAG TPA: glycogen debranching N-terminal domain-containing protein [Limnochordales bacterium]
MIKHDGVFLVTNAAGDAPGKAGDPYGLFWGDTRFLSRYELTTDDGQLEVVAHSTRAGDRGRIVLLPDPASSWKGPERELVIERERVIRGGLIERIRIANRGNAPCSLRLWLHLAADFKDMFEVRGMRRSRRGTLHAPVAGGDGSLRFGYTGLDGWRYETEVRLSPAPAELVLEPATLVLEPSELVSEPAERVLEPAAAQPERAGTTGQERSSGETNSVPSAHAAFVCSLEPKCDYVIEVQVAALQQPGSGHTGAGEAATDARFAARSGRSGPQPLPSLVAAWAQAEADEAAWRAGCAVWRTDSAEINAVLRQAERDLRMLLNDFGHGLMPVAGVPWYAVPFGRDSLITSLQTLPLRPELAAATLRTLASWQGRRRDPWRDEAPGKILHELRTGEIVRTNEVPFGPYFGTVDATPLFIILAGEYWRWTGDDDLIRELLPALKAAAAWMDTDGDLDGDGYVEYHRRHDGGLANQGWKDSGDGIVHRDGRLAEPPIALSEVQGYVYAARRHLADMLEAVGDAEGAAYQRERAARLKAAFDRDFWVEETGFYALALERDKRQVASVTTNPGHCLWSGIVPQERAARMAQVLLSPEMFSGYGIRTLSSSEHAYHPLSYHRGTVWPHDNSLIALGLARYGQGEAAARIAGGLFAAASFDPYRRLPELFSGYPATEDGPVGYPVACVPQAWAAATPFMLLQAVLGLEVDAPGNRIFLSPHLPDGVNRVEVTNLRFGDRQLHITVERQPGGEFAWTVDASSAPRPDVQVRAGILV